jgi:predicted ferric reductase
MKQVRIPLFIQGSVICTLAIWLFTVPDYDFIVQDPWLAFSKIAALSGTIYLCWAFLLATRSTLFAASCGGLDQMYHAHKQCGQYSFVLICLHPLFQLLRFTFDWNRTSALLAPKALWGLGFGILAFLLFVVLIALTLWIKLRYHIWKRTHEFFVLVLLATSAHIFLLDKHIHASHALSIWMYSFLGAALFSYLYIRFLYYYYGPRYRYYVDAIERIRQTWNIYLMPLENTALSYTPGQFLYISFDNPALGTEIHPFSISSYPGQPFLRLSIKNLGDYTARIPHLCVGDNATVWGPYGCFAQKYFLDDTDAVFIAGGIGITPFLSMLGYEAHNPRKRKTYIFYCVKETARADFHTELLEHTKRNPFIIYVPYHCTASSGFLNIEKIHDMVGPLRAKNFFLCGPPAMMNSFITQLRASDVPDAHIIAENFNFK